jgi:DNA-binding transcriptional regulator YhcF (GntR family)
LGVNYRNATRTIWQPDLTGRSGPRYRQIVEALASDITTARLRAGDRLPAQRDLAWRLKVTVGTVSRAYSEAERRGLVSGEVGRGTFVRESTALPLILSDRDESLPINFSQNLPIPGPEAQLLAETLQALAGSNDLASLLQYQPHVGRLRDREAGAAWLSLSGVAADAARIAIVSGGQHAISTVLAAITEPSDVIATEAMTYPGAVAARQDRTDRTGCTRHPARLAGSSLPNRTDPLPVFYAQPLKSVRQRDPARPAARYRRDCPTSRRPAGRGRCLWLSD